MFKCDQSTVFKQTLLDASLKNKFGFQEKDILPLFLKYQSKRQILLDILSFLTYVFRLPTLFYLKRWRNSNFVLKQNRARWFKATGIGDRSSL